MRKVLASFILVFLLISLLNNPAYTNGENSADGENGEYDPFDKLARGTINLLVSPLEFFQGIGDAYGEHDIAVAFATGFFWGPVNMVKRAAVGIFEIVTFPFPQPSNYGPIIEEPIFLGEKAEKFKKERAAKAEEAAAKKAETKETVSEEDLPEPERHPMDYIPDMPDDMTPNL